MPFAWTAIHLVDIISGRQANTDPGTPQEKDSATSTPASRRVHILYTIENDDRKQLLVVCYRNYVSKLIKIQTVGTGTKLVET